jgi:DNA-binding transcriptional ArsR family regulator
MKRLGPLFSSAARTEILRALACHPDPIGLRQTARIAGVLPRSAELALAGLVKEELVTRQPSGARRLYRLNRGDARIPVLEAVFAAAAQGFIRAQNCSLGDRAKTLLPSIKEASRMVARARESHHVA